MPKAGTNGGNSGSNGRVTSETPPSAILSAAMRAARYLWIVMAESDLEEDSGTPTLESSVESYCIPPDGVSDRCKFNRPKRSSFSPAATHVFPQLTSLRLCPRIRALVDRNHKLGRLLEEIEELCFGGFHLVGSQLSCSLKSVRSGPQRGHLDIQIDLPGESICIHTCCNTAALTEPRPTKNAGLFRILN